MAKRRVVVDSDDDGSASPSAKRARTDEDQEEIDVEPSQGVPKSEKRSTRSNGRTRQDESSDDDDGAAEYGEDFERPQEEQNEEDERKFEVQHGDRIRAAIEARRQAYGGIAEHGIIESIEMVQFMCHKYLTFQFGPQINFIIGHNGSGKSAVLSAITIALGGKATSTGRGSGLKSFIREGQSVAEVTISIKNQGEEAFKPKEYGKSIVITRRFTKDGQSSWKIKSKEGRVISTKKDEISAICDHMNIQVDNPMNVLTQDAARQFLSASLPSDKYKFFLRGTQLSQLSEEYDTCLANINQTSKVLTQKKAVLPDLRTTFKEATVRFEEASKARDMRHKADELKKELAWAHVASKEEELRKKVEDVAKLRRRIPRIEEELKTAQAQFDFATEEVTKYEEEHRALGDLDHLNDQKKELQEKLRLNRNKLNDLRNDEKKMDTSLKGINRTIMSYTERIEEQAHRLEAQSQAKREETTRKLDEAKMRVAAADAELKSTVDQKRTRMEQQDQIKKDGLAIEQEKNAAQSRIQECETMIGRCRDQGRNNLAAYGKDIQAVLAQISKMRWQGDIPVGPLGVHVQVKDAQKWGGVLRSTLGSYMSAFVVTDSRDRLPLKRVLDATGNGQSQIIISGRDIFDYSSGEPNPQVLTVLRALEVSDPFVLRVLINQANIERIVLAATRLEGDKVVESLGGGLAWTADFMRVQRYSDGGGSSTRLQILNPGDQRHMLFTGKDPASEMRRWQNELRTAQDRYKATLGEYNRLQQEFQNMSRSMQDLTNQEKRALDRLREAKTAHATLQEEANEEMPAGIAGLQAAKDEAEAEKKSILEQFANLTSRKVVIDAEQKPLLEQLNTIKRQIDDFEEKRSGIRTQIEEAVSARVIAQSHREHYVKKIADENKKVADAEATAETVQTEFENWTSRAEEYCARVENPRKVDEVKRNLDSVQAALQERERRHGATVEEMTIEVNKAKAALDSAERDLKSLSTLNKALTSSLLIRLAKWQEFRRHIALRCKLVFQYHLSNRGYYGKVLFDHNLQTLHLKVQTDDQTSTQGRDKDPRSLSGGEKSFSTICLLLSLWDSIGCPLRCLDEFDVFMDAVNRKISMRMMIDTANASDKKQYILITPQDINIDLRSSVRVHRMTDPERGQGVLSF